VRPAAREQDDRLDKARLSGGIGAPDDMGARPERELEAGVSPQVEQAERVEQRRPGPASRPGLPVRYDVVRTGMTTWT
jgi:hypothetical protein